MAKTRDARFTPDIDDDMDDPEQQTGKSSPTKASPAVDLSKKVLNAIDAIKRPFRSYVEDFTTLAQTREELAPKFMKAFGMWQAETGQSFVDFVRYLAPEIGNTRAEYRNHRTYQAADYLRRLVGNASRQPKNQAERAVAPAPPTDALARIMASLMAIIPEAQQARIWNAVHEQLHWTDRQVQRLQTQVEHVDPLVQIRARGLENIQLRFPAPQQPAERETAAA